MQLNILNFIGGAILGGLVSGVLCFSIAYVARDKLQSFFKMINEKTLLHEDSNDETMLSGEGMHAYDYNSENFI